MGDVEQVPRQRSSARMGVRGTGGVGRPGRLEVHVNHFRNRRQSSAGVCPTKDHSLWVRTGSPLTTCYHRQLQSAHKKPQNTAHAWCNAAEELRITIISFSIGSKYTGIRLCMLLEIINEHYDSFADNHHSMWPSQETLRCILNTISNLCIKHIISSIPFPILLLL